MLFLFVSGLSPFTLGVIIAIPLLLLTKLIPETSWRKTMLRRWVLSAAGLLAFLITYVVTAWLLSVLAGFVVDYNVEMTYWAHGWPSTVVKQEFWYRIVLPPMGHFCYTGNPTVCQILDRSGNSPDGVLGWPLYLLRIGLSIFVAVTVCLIIWAFAPPEHAPPGQHALRSSIGWTLIGLGIAPLVLTVLPMWRWIF